MGGTAITLMAKDRLEAGPSELGPQSTNPLNGPLVSGAVHDAQSKVDGRPKRSA